MASILYLGTDEGVVTLKSEDGRSWKVEHHGLKDWQVPEVAVSPSAPNKVFAGTRGDGVWLSEDFGATWSKPSYGKRGPGKVRCLTIDPRDANTIYAGCQPSPIQWPPSSPMYVTLPLIPKNPTRCMPPCKWAT